MNNEQIILSNRVFLMEEGVIKGTGKMFIYEDDKGRREIEMPEEIHTFNEWKKLGFSVKKGEHSVARFPIWRMNNKKKKKEEEDEKEDKKENGFYYMKLSFFFTRNQVEEIKEVE